MAEKLNISFFYENILCDLSNERKFYQEYKFTIQKDFLIIKKNIAQDEIKKLSILGFFLKRRYKKDFFEAG